MVQKTQCASTDARGWRRSTARDGRQSWLAAGGGPRSTPTTGVGAGSWPGSRAHHCSAAAGASPPRRGSAPLVAESTTSLFSGPPSTTAAAGGGGHGKPLTVVGALSTKCPPPPSGVTQHTGTADLTSLIKYARHAVQRTSFCLVSRYREPVLDQTVSGSGHVT